MAVNDSARPTDHFDHHHLRDSNRLSSFAIEQMKQDFHERNRGIGADTSQRDLVKFLRDPAHRETVDYARIGQRIGRAVQF